MGECVFCSRKTNSVYTYYRGEVVSRSYSQAGNTSTTKTRYKNIAQLSNYVCPQCSTGLNRDPKSLRDSILIVAVPLVVCAALFALAAVTDNNILHQLSVIAALLLVLILVVMIRSVGVVLLDKGHDDANAVKMLSEKAKKEGDERTYFTAKEYKALKPDSQM